MNDMNRITESQIRQIVAESVKSVLNEYDYFDANPNDGKFPKDLKPQYQMLIVQHLIY